jgi:hypothetical protein
MRNPMQKETLNHIVSTHGFTSVKRTIVAMRRTSVALLLVALAVELLGLHVRGSFILAGEPVVFDEQLRPVFTRRQTQGTDPATREGLVRWAETGEGQRLIARFNRREFRVVIREDLSEDGAGRAPQPSLGTLVVANDHTKIKSYDLILNPAYGASKGFDPVVGAPSRQADFMAAAWAGEMLHIDFYSQGISLPHHERSDFQQEWRLVAGQLGFPTLPHEEDHGLRGRRIRG